MALVVRIRTLEGLEGKGERLLKATFREKTLESEVKNGNDIVYFGHEFKWPVGRHIDKFDTLELRAFTVSKILKNKCIGFLTVSLEQLSTHSSFSLTERLIDSNYSLVRTSITFEVSYYSPDAAVGEWHPEDFEFPVDTTDFPKRKGHSSSESDFDEELEIEVDYDAHRGIEIEESVHSASISPQLTGEDESLYGDEVRKTLPVDSVLSPTTAATETFQVSVVVHKAEFYTEEDIHPEVTVSLGDDIQRTDRVSSTKKPTYSKTCFFEPSLPLIELFNQVIIIKAYNKRTRWSQFYEQAKDIIGEFRIDIRSVYNAPGHAFYNKWACLIDPKDVFSGVKGFVCVSITVLGRNDQLKSAPAVKGDDDKFKSENILLPVGMAGEQQMYNISVCVYCAEELPKMNTDFVANVKTKMYKREPDYANPYVIVNFAGFEGRTRVKRASYEPRWQEELVFKIQFPPLCSRIRICVYDNDRLGRDSHIATHYIDLNQITSSKISTENGYLPTFGPSWVNLYGTPRSFGFEDMMRKNAILNLGHGEGAAYRGRLLIQIKAARCASDDRPTSDVTTRVAPELTNNQITKHKVDFLLVGVIYEASAIDAQSINNAKENNKRVYFELSIGTFGNKLDGPYNDDGQECVDPAKKAYLPMWCQSTTSPTNPTPTDSEYYHVNFADKKPCLYMRCLFEDYRPRMFIPNILDKLARDFDEDISLIQGKLRKENKLLEKGQHRAHGPKFKAIKLELQKLLLDFWDKLTEASDTVYSCRGTGIKNNLDKHRLRMIQEKIAKMKVKVKEMSDDKTPSSDLYLTNRLKDCRSLSRHLRSLIDDPQQSLPDVFVWMIVGGERVAFARIPARQVIHSLVEMEQGKDCGNVVTVFLKKPGVKGAGKDGWSLQAQLKMFLWLGLLKDLRHFRAAVPEGYEENTFKEKEPPKYIIYPSLTCFQFRAYMFMARNLAGSDMSGLSDAFARIIVNDQIVTTPVVSQSLSPNWDCTLVLDKITLYQSRKTIMENPPVIVVDLFDDDQDTETGRVVESMKDTKYMGRAFCKCLVTWHDNDGTNIDDSFERLPLLPASSDDMLSNSAEEVLSEQNTIITPERKFSVYDLFGDVRQTLENLQNSQKTATDEEAESVGSVAMNDQPQVFRELPRLEWWDVYRGHIWAGQLLASFHLLELENNQPSKIPDGVAPLPLVEPGKLFSSVPKILKPKTGYYRIEVLFWGVRDLSMITLRHCRRPQMLAEFGGIVENPFETEVLENFYNDPNFKKRLVCANVMLPYNRKYWPPLTFKCQDHLQFAGIRAVGIAVVSNVAKYFVDYGKLAKIKEEKNEETKSVAKSHKSGQSNGHAVVDFPGEEGVVNPGAVLVDIDGPGGEGDISKIEMGDGVKPPGAAVDTTVPETKRPPKDLVVQVDWWTRFHYSELALNVKSDDETLDGEDSDDVDALEGIEAPDVELSDIEPDVIASTGKGSKKKKKKKRKKKRPKKKYDKEPLVEDDKKPVKKKRKTPLAVIGNALPNPKAKFLEEDFGDLLYNDNIEIDMSWITTFTIYPGALEEVPEFGAEKDHCLGFEQMFKTYPLLRGPLEDENEAPDNRLVGRFKGNIRVYPITEEEFSATKGQEDKIPEEDYKLYADIPLYGKGVATVEVLVRCYIVCCRGLPAFDPNGFSDPYLEVVLSEKVQNDRENYKPMNLNPKFGKCFEFNVTFPQESLLDIYVFDKDDGGDLTAPLPAKARREWAKRATYGTDDLIGSTTIDLENRYFSKHRATCGLASVYSTSGYNSWRDSEDPESILKNLCIKHKIPLPVYDTNSNQVTVGQQTFRADASLIDESGGDTDGPVKTRKSKEPLALEVLKNWDKVAGFHLVPEHLEARPLYNSKKPGIPQGRIYMWVDMFPKKRGDPPSDYVYPPIVDIKPRELESFELRVTIHDTKEVVLDDVNILTGERSSDIFIRGRMKRIGNHDQQTDTHSNSVTGEGNFNWRLIFKFKYDKFHDRIFYHEKKSYGDAEWKEDDCVLTLEVWDEDIICADSLLGSHDFKLTKFPRGARSPSTCGLYQTTTPYEVPTFNLFKDKKNRKFKGWWPLPRIKPEDEKSKKKRRRAKKKGKEIKKEEPVIEIGGKVSAEFELLTKEEADANPAGRGREEPQPLQKPNRPESSIFGMLQPLKIIKYLVCVKFRCILIKLLAITLLTAIIALFIYSSPGYIAKKLIGA